MDRLTPIGEPVLEVENAVKHFGAGRVGGVVRAVDDVSFVVRRAETVALVGESGCGKSTLGRLVMCFDRPTSGSVRYEGEEIFMLGTAALRRYRRGVQMVFQDPNTSLNPRLTVARSIQRAWESNRSFLPRAQWRSRIAELLDMVGLSSDRAGFYPHQLSGGQRQRVAIARALALQPKVVICDEPVSALDVSIQAQILALLYKLQSTLGVSYLFISHDLDVVRRISHRVLVMYLGRIVETGTVADVFERPAHPYTRALLAAVPKADPNGRTLLTRRLLEGEPPSPYSPPSGCRFRTRCPIAQDACSRTDPSLVNIGQEHRAACLFPVREPEKL